MDISIEELLNPAGEVVARSPMPAAGRDVELIHEGMTLLADLFGTFLDVGGLQEVRRRAVEDAGMSEEDADRLYYLLDEGVILVDYAALPETEGQQ